MATEKRLIEVETVIEKIRKANCADCYNSNGVLCRACLVDDFISLLDDSTAVDAVEAKHGRWDEIEEEVWHLYKRWPLTRFRCSQCKQMENKKSNYCPNCGAKMDGDGNG